MESLQHSENNSSSTVDSKSIMQVLIAAGLVSDTSVKFTESDMKW